MEPFQTISTNSVSSTIKSASFLHILPFVFLYILKNHEKIEVVQCDSDKLYKYVPNKSKVFHPNIKWMLLSVPTLLLLFKSNNNLALEHTLVILSYAIALKTSMHYMTPCLAKQEFTNTVAIVLMLNLRYFDIIPSEHTQAGFIGVMMYSLFLISTRETTSANVISDYSITLLSFLLPKYLG